MPVLPPFGKEDVRSETNRRGLPDRFMRTLEQWRSLLGPLPRFLEQTGSPEGSVTAERGTQYLQADAKQFFVKASEDGNTGWLALSSLLPDKVESANFTLGNDHVGKMTRLAGAGSVTLIDATTPPVGSWGVIINDSGATLSVLAATGVNMVTAGLGFGGRSLAYHGATLWWHGPTSSRYWLLPFAGLT